VPSLPVAEVQHARRQRLREVMAASDVDGALVTHLVNVRYLTGFSGSNGALLVTHDDAVLATDGRYETQVGEQAPDVRLVVDRELVRALTGYARGANLHRLAFEDHHLTVVAHDSLQGHAAEASFTLSRLGLAIEAMRAVKDETEVATLRAACAVTDAAYAELLERVHAGMTEGAAAQLLETAMRDRGAEGPAFETIVASGPNGALPHHRAGDRVLRVGDLVTCDFGARVDGYHADMTRTFVVAQAADWQREVYGVVAAAQLAGRVAVAVDADCRAVDGSARAVVDATAYAGRFVHGLGHGVGLEIHEAPWLGQTASGTLGAGNTVTVEPGIYLPDRGGVRIEDTLVVRAGSAEVLTASPRELIVV
jgi:Xaa-Pro aminopeptidase